jgi:hypothetical protein
MNLIKINARGEYMEVDEDTLISIPYFYNLLGRGNFPRSPCQKDGSYYVNYSKEIFEHLLLYIQYGTLPTNKYNADFLDKVSSSLGVTLKGPYKVDLYKQTEAEGGHYIGWTNTFDSLEEANSWIKEMGNKQKESTYEDDIYWYNGYYNLTKL